MRVTTRSTTGPVLALLALCLVLPAPAEAQLFRVPATLEQLREQADQAAAEQLAAERRQEELAARAEENAERWEQMLDYEKDRARDMSRAGSSDEDCEELFEMLLRRRRYGATGLLYYNLGMWRQAKSAFMRSIREEGESFQAAAYVMGVRLEIIDLVEDKEPDRYRDRLAREVGDLRQALEQQLARMGRVDINDVQRSNRLPGDIFEYLANVEEWMAREYELRTAIQADTWDAELVWQLARLYADQLALPHRARIWFEIMRDFHPDAINTRTGRVDAEIAEIMLKQGMELAGREHLTAARTRVSDGINDLRAQQAELVERARSGEEDFTGAERELARLNLNAVQNQVDRLFDQTANRMRQYRNWYNSAADRERPEEEDKND